MNQILGTVIPVGDFLSPKEQVIRNDKRNGYCLDAGRTYIIPDFQREIRWEAEQVIELINNIGDGSRFLGNIILSETARKNVHDEAENSLKDYEIIDGQQRITTLLMIIRFIRFKYGKDLNLDNEYCALKIESFKGFSKLYENGFDEKTSLLEEISKTDDLNQIPHYMQLWQDICDYSKDMSSRLRNKDSCQSLLENLRDSQLNVIINTSGNNSHSIKFFLDVNLKGKKLDTEDVFKSYLFYYDSSAYIRELWVSIKKLSSKLTVTQGKKIKYLYPLMEIIRHSFYCNLYKEKNWKSIEISNSFELSKAATVLGDNESEKALHYRGEHIIDVLKSQDFLRRILKDVEEFLIMANDVLSTKMPSNDFSKLFNVRDGNKKVDTVTITIAHAFIRRIIYDDTILPKAVLFKYFITTLDQEQENKDAYKWIYDVYAFNILFNLSAIKKQKEIVLNIVSEKKENSDWHAELSTAIQGFLKENELSRAKVALQYKYADEEFNEECLSRGLAVLYNYFSINKGRCSVRNELELKSFLTNTEKYSLEHLIINKSKKYELSSKKTYLVQGEAGKCVNSMFNFIFISENINNKELANKTIREKMEILAGEKIDCNYSQKVLELVNRFFIDESASIHTPGSDIETFPRLDGQLTDDEKEAILNEYFDEESECFFKTFQKFSSEVLVEVYKKMAQ